jgi:hypothetical protein
MSYAVRLADDVGAAIRVLPIDLAELVLDQIDRLADDPTMVSSSASLPSPAGQAYYFHHGGLERDYTFMLLFQYSQDEQSLHILRPAWVTVEH